MVFLLAGNDAHLFWRGLGHLIEMAATPPVAIVHQGDAGVSVHAKHSSNAGINTGRNSDEKSEEAINDRLVMLIGCLDDLTGQNTFDCSSTPMAC